MAKKKDEEIKTPVGGVVGDVVDPKIPSGTPKAEDNSELMGLLQGIAKGMADLSVNVGDLTNRVHRIETGGKEEFKAHPKPEDIAKAKTARAAVDPRIVAIVDEILGEDFEIDVKPNKDRPGYLFSLIVPTRLSGSLKDKRPMRDPAKPGEYLKDAAGIVIQEDYTPEDRRSRVLSGLDNFDVIRNHCERVRSFIVAYFQKVSKPLPEFKVK